MLRLYCILPMLLVFGSLSVCADSEKTKGSHLIGKELLVFDDACALIVFRSIGTDEMSTRLEYRRYFQELFIGLLRRSPEKEAQEYLQKFERLLSEGSQITVENESKMENDLSGSELLIIDNEFAAACSMAVRELDREGLLNLFLYRGCFLHLSMHLLLLSNHPDASTHLKKFFQRSKQCERLYDKFRQ